MSEGRKKSYWRDKRMKKTTERWQQMVLFQLQR